MPIFVNGCGSDEGTKKVLKFEGNTVQILQGSSSVFSSSDLSLRQWYDEVSTWASSSMQIAPADSTEFTGLFDFIFCKVTPPILPAGTSGVTLEFQIELFKVGSVTADVTFLVRDVFMINLGEDFEKIVFSNTSTGTTLSYDISYFVAKTTL